MSTRLLPTAALVAAAFLAGCASYDSNVAQEVSVKSTPSGASVAINGKDMGQTTDTSFVLNRDQDYVIEVSKSGYKPTQTHINHRATGAAAGAATWELEPTAVSLTLDVDPVVAAAQAKADAEEKVAADAKLAEERKADAEKLAAAEHEKAEADDKIKAEADAKAAAESQAAKAAEEAKAKADAEDKARAEDEEAKADAAKLKSEEDAAAKAVADEQANDAAAKATKTTAKTDDDAKKKADEATADKLVAEEQAADAASHQAAKGKSYAPASVNTALTTEDVFARYKALRKKLAAGAVSQEEYAERVKKIAL